MNYWLVVCSLGHRNNWRALILVNECLARVLNTPCTFASCFCGSNCVYIEHVKSQTHCHMHVVCGHAVFTFNTNTEMAVRG